MANKHYQKWVLQMPFGFLLTAGGILVIMYAANKRASDEWLIWGIIWLRTRNLYITIVAHAVEVIVMYSAVRAVIG